MYRKGTARGSAATSSKDALVAAAIQDHLLRSLMPVQSLSSSSLAAVSSKNGKKKIKSQYAQAKPAAARSVQREMVITENAPPLTLAEKLGVFEAPKVNLTEEEWQIVKGQALARGAFIDVCPICQDSLGSRQEILLSCSHTFHRNCISSLERFAGQRVCPICRQHAYEARLIYDATNLHRIRCIVKIQAWWRGCLARCEYRKLRKLIPPQDPRLRKRFFEEKLSEITDKLVQSDVPDVNSFLSHLDRSVERARRIYRQFDENYLSEAVEKQGVKLSGQWEEIVEMAFNRDDDTCPICLSGLGVCTSQDTSDNKDRMTRCASRMDKNGVVRPVMLLSCSHLFHSSCLESFEHFAKEAATADGSNNGSALLTPHVCPLCRTPNYDKICLQTLFSN